MAGIHILVVEDNEMQSKLVSFLLQEAGHNVQTAGSGEEALEALRSFSPVLILMDLQLPGMDGLELTCVLRLDPVQATTPIIALTPIRIRPIWREPARRDATAKSPSRSTRRPSHAMLGTT